MQPLLKPLLAYAKCDRCREFKKCLYIPELDNWVCFDCLDILLEILDGCCVGLREGSFE